MNDRNNRVIVTSTGTCPSSNARMVEMIIEKNSIGTVTAAVTFIDNDNGDTDEDEVRINTSGTALITGLDTLDLPTTEGDGPGPDVTVSYRRKHLMTAPVEEVRLITLQILKQQVY